MLSIRSEQQAVLTTVTKFFIATWYLTSRQPFQWQAIWRRNISEAKRITDFATSYCKFMISSHCRKPRTNLKNICVDLDRWFSTSFVPRPMEAIHYNVTTLIHDIHRPLVTNVDWFPLKRRPTKRLLILTCGPSKKGLEPSVKSSDFGKRFSVSVKITNA